MTAPRGLSIEEAEAWDKIAATVKPLHPAIARVKTISAGLPPAPTHPPRPQMPAQIPTRPVAGKPVLPPQSAPAPSLQPRGAGLDSHWDRRLKSGSIQPDFTLDLHGHGLDAAYTRLMSGVAQARVMGARTILLVTGKPRPVESADRAQQRGAIRAKILDWLAASSHHSAIAAIRNAHRHHGGNGALYVILKRDR